MASTTPSAPWRRPGILLPGGGRPGGGACSRTGGGPAEDRTGESRWKFEPDGWTHPVSGCAAWRAACRAASTYSCRTPCRLPSRERVIPIRGVMGGGGRDDERGRRSRHPHARCSHAGRRRTGDLAGSRLSGCDGPAWPLPAGRNRGDPGVHPLGCPRPAPVTRAGDLLVCRNGTDKQSGVKSDGGCTPGPHPSSAKQPGRHSYAACRPVPLRGSVLDAPFPADAGCLLEILPLAPVEKDGRRVRRTERRRPSCREKPAGKSRQGGAEPGSAAGA